MLHNSPIMWLLMSLCFTLLTLTIIPLYDMDDLPDFQLPWQPKESLKSEDKEFWQLETISKQLGLETISKQLGLEAISKQLGLETISKQLRQLETIYKQLQQPETILNCEVNKLDENLKSDGHKTTADVNEKSNKEDLTEEETKDYTHSYARSMDSRREANEKSNKEDLTEEETKDYTYSYARSMDNGRESNEKSNKEDLTEEETKDYTYSYARSVDNGRAEANGKSNKEDLTEEETKDYTYNYARSMDNGRAEANEKSNKEDLTEEETKDYTYSYARSMDNGRAETNVKLNKEDLTEEETKDYTYSYARSMDNGRAEANEKSNKEDLTEETKDYTYSYARSMDNRRDILKELTADQFNEKLTIAAATVELSEEKSKEIYTYVASVVEYRPIEDALMGIEKLMKNAEAYVEFAKKAKNAKSDIIVFPEYGLTSPFLPTIHSGLQSYSQIVPDPAVHLAPCDFPDYIEYASVLKLLSCAARDLEIYMVIDLVEQDSSDKLIFLYNTQVVFDRHGVVIARYRKINLYTELQFNRGPLDLQSAMFTTDFGVTFGLGVCYDILYESPTVHNVLKNGVKHVIMSTAWMDQLPSLTALQMQSGFAEKLKINLLIANVHYPFIGATGSGIYPGDTDLEHRYIYYTDESQILSMHITNNPSHQDTQNNIGVKLEYGKSYVGRLDFRWNAIKYENLGKYSHLILKNTKVGEMVTKRLCHGDELCCNVDYTWPDHDNDTIYMLLAYDGFKIHGGGLYTNYYQYCSVLFCTSKNVTSCAHIKKPKSNSLQLQSLYATFLTPHVYPSFLFQDLTIPKRNVWSVTSKQVKKDQWDFRIQVDKAQEAGQVLAFTLFGRIFERDIPFDPMTMTKNNPYYNKDYFYVQ